MANPAEGFFGGLLVMGFIGLHAFIYSQMYPNDTTVEMSCFSQVIWVFFLDTSHTVFCIILLYYYLIANFGNVSAWKSLNRSMGAVVLTQVLISSTVEAIYVRRIWFVSGNAILLTSFLYSLDRFIGFGLLGTFCVLNFTLWRDFKAHSYTLPIVSLSLSLGAFADLLIAITFSTYLLRGRNQYSRASRTLANMLILYAINTGAATATTSVISVIVYGSVRSGLAFFGLSEMGAKLYANCFLGSLNSRAFLRHKNLGRGFTGFGPTSAVDVELNTFPSDSPPPHEPPVSIVEFTNSIACETPSTRTPGEASTTRV